MSDVCTASCAAAGGDGYCTSNFASDPYCETGSADPGDTGQCVQCNIVGGTPSGGTVDECGFATPNCKNDVCTTCTVLAQCANRVDGRTICSGGECDQCIVTGADPTCPATGPICGAGLCGGKCSGDADCSARSDGNVHCDAGTGACVPCNVTGGTMECSAMLPNCVSDACTKCSANAQCSVRTDGNTSCDTVKGACVPCNTTGSTNECPDSAPVCGLDQCGACSGPTDCVGRTSGNSLCVGGACVQCNSTGFDALCVTLTAGAKPICAAHVCTACSLGSQCPTTAPICTPATGCAACGNDGQCLAQHAATPHCDSSGGSFNGQCVVCTANAQCTKTAPTCVGDTCTAGCTTNAVCSSYTPDNTLCDTDTGVEPLKGECVGCLAASGCTSASPTCPTATRQCSACSVDTDCSSYAPAKPHCDTTGDSRAGQCVQCDVNTQCPATDPVCTSNSCVGCSQQSDCTRFNGTFTALCNTSTGACVSCLSNSNCTATAPVCNAADSCVGCSTDTDCSLYPTKPACQLAGSTNPGTCGQCARDNTSQCMGGTPACNYDNGKCQLCTVGGVDMGGVSVGCSSNINGTACQGSGTSVFCGCFSDSDCGNATSGRICDQVAHTCADGCSRAPGRNNCPASEFCTSDDLSGQTSGICTKTCAFDVDCQSTMPTLPYCLGGVLLDGGSTLPDGGGSTSRCAGCRTNGDCSGATSVCEPSEKICVQCTAQNASGCSAASTGAICLDDETCGCAVDSDCGNATSGRICDRFMQKCTTGCYLVGGNGCPSGMVCTAAGANAGSCVTNNDMGMASLDLSVPPDLSVPVDHAVNRNSVTGGGLTCAMEGHGSPQSLWLLAAVVLWLASRRRRARSFPSQE